MKITVEITKKKLVFIGIVALICVLAHFLTGISIFNMWILGQLSLR